MRRPDHQPASFQACMLFGLLLSGTYSTPKEVFLAHRIWVSVEYFRCVSPARCGGGSTMMGTVRYDHCLKQGDGQISLEWELSAEVTWKINQTLAEHFSHSFLLPISSWPLTIAGDNRIGGPPRETLRIQATGTQVPGMWVFHQVTQNTITPKAGDSRT